MEHAANTSGTRPVMIEGQLTGINLLLTVAIPEAPPDTPPQEFVLYRGGGADFSGIICALAERSVGVPPPGRAA
jgi:hypothetical protein